MGKPDRYFLIRYGKDGKVIQEAVGWASQGITAQSAANIRSEILRNIITGEGHQSLKEKRIFRASRKRAAETEAITLSGAFEEFLKTRTLKPRTVQDYRRSMEVAFPDWKRRRVIDINRDSVAQRHEKLGKNQGAAQANQHMRFLRSLLNFCAGFYEDAQGHPLIKFNPVQRLSQTKAWYRVPRKQTIIKDHQLPAWFKAVLELRSEIARDYIQFLALTGSRRGEGLTLEVDQVDLKSGTYTILDPKNRQPLTLPFPKYLFRIIKTRIEKLPKGTKYVFPGSGSKGHFSDPKRQVANMIERSGVKFTLHDLRRHFITIADGLDLSVFAIKRLVNHSMGSDVTSGYVVSDVERLRGPMQKIEDRILVLAGVNKKGKIVPIKSAI